MATLASDTFNRADTASGLGTTSDGLFTWASALPGSLKISGNRVVLGTSSTADPCTTIDPGQADVTVQATMVTTGGDTSLVGRYTDDSNYWLAHMDSTGPVRLFKKVAGSYTQVSPTSGSGPNPGDLVQLVFSGSTVTMKVNGTTIFTTTDTFNSTATKAGFRIGSNSGAASWDNFSVFTAGAQTAAQIEAVNAEVLTRPTATPTQVEAVQAEVLIRSSNPTAQVENVSAEALVFGRPVGTLPTEMLADNPLAYWRMNEASTPGTCADSSPNGRTLTRFFGSLDSTPSGLADGVSALQFSGSTALGPTSSTFAYTNGDLTIEAWVKTTGTGDMSIVSLDDIGAAPGSAQRAYNLYFHAGSITFMSFTTAGGYPYIATPGTYNDGNWHHVVATRIGLVLSIWVDGALRVTTTATGTWVTPSGIDLFVGSTRHSGGSNYYWSGALDEVAMYGYGLSPSRIAARYAVGPSGYSRRVYLDAPAAYFRLNEASGTTMVDASGNNRNGTLSGATLGQAALYPGGPPSALGGSSGQGVGSVTAAPWMTFGRSYSVEFWAKINTTGDAVGLMSRYNGTAGGWVVWQRGGYIGFTYIPTVPGTNQQDLYGVVFSVGQIVHVAYVQDGNKAWLYINGVEVIRVTVDDSTFPSTLPDIEIGGYAGTNYSGATFSEAAYYTYPLNSAQVRNHYDGTPATYPPLDPSTLTSLAARFDAQAISGATDGQALATWLDSSGKGKHATQASTTSQPVYKTNQLNGWPAVRFDGVDDFLSSPSLFGSRATNTVVAVLRTRSFAAVQVPWGLETGGGGSDAAINTAGTRALFAPGGYITYAGGTTTLNTFERWTNVSRNWVNTSRVPKNGAVLYINGADLLADSQLGAGDVITMGKSVAQGFPAPVDIAELLVFDSPLTDAQIRGLDAYLANKWAVPTAGTSTGTVTATLPSLSSSESGTVTNPVSSGPVTATLPPLSGTGTGSLTAPPTATVAAVLPSLSATATGTHTSNDQTGTVAALLPPMGATGTGTAVPPPVTGAVDVTLPPLGATETGTVVGPTVTGAMDATLPPLAVSITNVRLAFDFTGDSSFTFATSTTPITFDFTGTSDLSMDTPLSSSPIAFDFDIDAAANVVIPRARITDPVTGKAAYSIVVVDKDGTRYAEFDKVQISPMTEELNGMGGFDFTVPANDPKTAECLVPQREVQVWRGRVLEGWYVLVRARGDDKTITFSAVGLEWYFTRRVVGQSPMPNLLKNGSFEDGERYWTFGYVAGSVPAKPPIHSISDITINGSKSLKISGASDVINNKTLLEADVLFAFDSYALTPAGVTAVNNLCASLTVDNPDIRCEGHADSTGSSAYNYTLALNRANAVKNQILSQKPSANVTVVSYGETRPRASNATAAGRAQNRRVEVYYKAVQSAKGHRQYAGQSFDYTNPTSAISPKTLTLVGWTNIQTYVAPSKDGWGVYMQLVNKATGKVKATANVPIGADTPRHAWTRMECSLAVPADGVAYRVDVRLYPPEGTTIWDEIGVTASETLSFRNIDEALIVKGLVEHAQDVSIGKSPLNIGTYTPLTKVKRSREYPWIERLQISEALNEFPTLADGVDIAITHTATTRTLCTYHPRKANKTGYVLALGSNIATVSVDIDGDQTSTRVIVQADGEGSDREEGVWTDATKMDGLVLEKVYNATPGSAISSLVAQAKRGIARYSRPLVLPQVTMDSRFTDEILDRVTKGDIVQVQIKQGWLDIDWPYRVTSLSLDPATDQITFALTPEDA